MKRIVMAVVILSTVLLTAACAGDPSNTSDTQPVRAITGTSVEIDGGIYWELTPAQFNGLLRNNSAYLVNLDGNNRQFEITGTKLFIDADFAAKNIDLFPQDKATIIALYCLSGTKSPPVVSALVSAGYTNVAVLKGGIISWMQQGYPSKSNTSESTES